MPLLKEYLNAAWNWSDKYNWILAIAVAVFLSIVGWIFFSGGVPSRQEGGRVYQKAEIGPVTGTGVNININQFNQPADKLARDAYLNLERRLKEETRLRRDETKRRKYMERRNQEKDETIKNLSKSFSDLLALKRQPISPPGIEDAVKELRDGDPHKAKAIFSQILRDKEKEGKVAYKEAAQAAINLGTLAQLDNQRNALKFFQKATILDPNNPEAWNRLGDIYSFMNDNKKAQKAYESVRDLALATGSAEWLATAYNNLGVLMVELGRHQEAKELYEKALSIRRSMALDSHLTFSPDMARVCNNLGILLKNMGRHREAQKMLDEVLALRRVLAQLAPRVYNPNLANICTNLGNLKRKIGQRQEAKKLLEEALSLRKSLAKVKPKAFSPAVADSYLNLGALFWEMGRGIKARQLMANALSRYRSLASAEPQAYNARLARACTDMGAMLGAMGEYHKAKSLYR